MNIQVYFEGLLKAYPIYVNQETAKERVSNIKQTNTENISTYVGYWNFHCKHK